jgi:hypothetical protein
VTYQATLTLGAGEEAAASMRSRPRRPNFHSKGSDLLVVVLERGDHERGDFLRARDVVGVRTLRWSTEK